MTTPHTDHARGILELAKDNFPGVLERAQPSMGCGVVSGADSAESRTSTRTWREEGRGTEDEDGRGRIREDGYDDSRTCR